MNSLAILVAAFSLAGFPMDLSSVQGNVVIRGTVRDVWHHKAISGALVYAVSETGVQATVANSNGNFYFLTLLPGNYKLSAQKIGYIGECMAWGHQDALELAAGFEYDATVWLTNECK